ncbi:MAG TPA: hypothetical protein VK905_05110, partial [Bacillota bacterium]|nr:hypothetical protein [Bacillota bacterium]
VKFFDAFAQRFHLGDFSCGVDTVLFESGYLLCGGIAPGLYLLYFGDSLSPQLVEAEELVQRSGLSLGCDALADQIGIIPDEVCIELCGYLLLNFA